MSNTERVPTAEEQHKRTSVPTKRDGAVLIHGNAVGRLDVENILGYFHESSLKECRLFLKARPIDELDEMLSAEENFHLHITENPRKDARRQRKNLRTQGRRSELHEIFRTFDKTLLAGGY